MEFGRFIDVYFELGLKYSDIKSILASRHAFQISERHLKRILRDRGHSRRKVYSDLSVLVDFISHQLQYSGQLHGECVEFWLTLFADLRDNGFFDGGFLDKGLLQFCCMGLIQDELDDTAQARVESLAPLAASASDLTFEQQKELLLLQLEHAKTLKSVEIEKQIAVEKLRYQTEQAKLSVEQSRLELLRAGFSGGAASGAQESSSVRPGGGGKLLRHASWVLAHWLESSCSW
ncbi:unnamed protein product [Gadus morhua 'NCC']